jgi:hypothetical protein
MNPKSAMDIGAMEHASDGHIDDADVAEVQTVVQGDRPHSSDDEGDVGADESRADACAETKTPSDHEEGGR